MSSSTGQTHALDKGYSIFCSESGFNKIEHCKGRSSDFVKAYQGACIKITHVELGLRHATALTNDNILNNRMQIIRCQSFFPPFFFPSSGQSKKEARVSFGLDLVSWLQELVGASMKMYLTTMRRKRNSDLT